MILLLIVAPVLILLLWWAGFKTMQSGDKTNALSLCAVGRMIIILSVICIIFYITMVCMSVSYHNQKNIINEACGTTYSTEDLLFSNHLIISIVAKKGCIN